MSFSALLPTTSAQANPVGLCFTTALKDWQKRQQLQHESEKPFSVKDFLGLKDFSKLMSSYSSTNFILRSAWQVIKSIALKNAEAAANLVKTTWGTVSSEVLQVPHFQDVFVHPDEILSNPDMAKSIMAASVQLLS